MSLPQRLLRIVPVLAAAAVLCWSATLNNDDDCRTIGECLGTGFDDLVMLALAVLLTAIAFRLLRVPRVVLHTGASLLVGCALWFGAGELLHAINPDRPYDLAIPAWVAVAVGLVTGVATSYVVGPGSTTRRQVVLRVAVPVVVVALVAGSSYASERAAREQRMDEIAAAPVTLFAPTIAGADPRSAYASADRVRISYSLEVDGEYTYLSVELVPTPTGSLCEELLMVPGHDCVEDGETLRNNLGGGYTDVALVRGATTLVADFDSDRLDPDDVLQALRDAPEVATEELA